MTSVNNNNQPMHATEWGSNPTVEVFLKGLSNDVESTVSAVIDAQNNSVMRTMLDGGQNVAVAVANAKNAYYDYLQTTVSSVDNVAQGKLQEVQSFVGNLQSRDASLLNNIVQNVNDYVKSLPLINNQPRLDSVSPQYILLNSDKDVVIECNGNFPISDDPNLAPSLTFRNTFKLLNATKEKLSFVGKIQDIFPQVLSVDKYSYAVGTLKVPFDNTPNLPWYAIGKKDIKTFEYRILENALPMSPGKITALYTFTKEGTPVQQPFVSTTVHNDAWAMYGRGSCSHWNVKNYTINPHPGFQFIVGTQRLVLTSQAHGNHAQRISSATPSAITVTVSLDSCSGKHNGIIDWHVEANEIMHTTVEDYHQDLVSLNWGEEKEVPLESDGRYLQMSFAAFDGSYSEFGSGEDLSNRYIKVYNEGSKLKIVATSPDDMTLMKV